MKIGDLVKLSAYGNVRQYNFHISADEVGLIIKIDTRLQYGYTIHWSKYKCVGSPHSAHCRRELKYA